MTQERKTKYLKDYQEPNYLVSDVEISFDIYDDKVVVTNNAKYFKNNKLSNELILNGSSQLIDIKLDNNEIRYQLENNSLIITDLPDNFSLQIVTEVDPYNNKSCMGLFASGNILLTQNEPEGFRKITFYQDRPDVMAKFTTIITADKNKYPILLSNGNKVHEEILENNRHKVIWEDPFNKPCYLFALSAGQFEILQDYHITTSGRKVLLEIYSDKDSIDQCHHGINSLKRAMIWDEERFNLEYDLDRYMIVASNDFNAGAMENKGLNIFNTKYVLADSKTATDTDFINVEAVIGHEYFHNWTGNRVTCRDWFQLSLKEGLTVFRDQEFTADLHSRTVKRIQDVKALKQNQFPEDASALAHPIRPASYIEMNNFYTMTVYEKGAEVVRMYQTILGKDGFNKGMKLYFERHDGTAATCEDFCNAMADANNFDLSQFMLWYSQAGTPNISIVDSYDNNTQIYRLEISQQIPDTPDMKDKLPMMIPIGFGFLNNDGQEIEIQVISGNIIKPENKNILLLDKSINMFEFKVKEKPTPSFLREFSAPVNIQYNYTTENITVIASHDTDLFNRWEAIQFLFKKAINTIYDNKHDDKLINDIVTALNNSLTNQDILPNIKALLVGLPSFAEIAANYKPTHAHNLIHAITKLKYILANKLENLWLKTYQDNQKASYNFNDHGHRALKNIALSYLIASDNSTKYLDIVALQYQQADNMTDKIAALSAINDTNDELREELLANFAQEYEKYPLVMDKWFMLQAQSQNNDTLDKVKKLTQHHCYYPTNPNKIYSLVRAFAGNHKLFNTIDGYGWIASEVLRINKFNPSVASRVASCFSVVNNLNSNYKQIAKPILEQIISDKDITNDVYEVISKIL